MEGRTLWKLGVALAVVSSVLLYQRLRPAKDSSIQGTYEWPDQKNFGAFPPDLPETMFDEATFV